MDWGGGAPMDSRVACHAGGRPVERMDAVSPTPLLPQGLWGWRHFHFSFKAFYK